MLVLTRQNLPVLDGTAENAETELSAKELVNTPANGDIIIATGSGKLALDTRLLLK